MAAVVEYSPPWWVNLLHRLPHFNIKFEQTSSDFQPEDWTYQQVRSIITRPVIPFAAHFYEQQVYKCLSQVCNLDFDQLQVTC